MSKTKKGFCWGVILILLVLMHIYKIDEIPYGINVDEMGMGYDAWCLANFGTDRYLNSFPVYLINFSGGQSALYAYLCMPFVYFGGISALTLRIPAVIFSFITLYFLVKIANYLWKDEKISVLVGGLYAILPVFTMIFRIGLDCNLMLGMSTAFMYLFFKAVESGKCRNYLVAGIVAGLLLYSYVLSHTVMPVFLVLVVIYLVCVKRFDWKGLLVFAVPVALLALPLIIFHIANMFGLGELKIGPITIPQLYNYRSGDLAFSEVIGNLGEFWKNTLTYDSLSFDSIPQFGNIYVVSIPLLMIGIIRLVYLLFQSIRERKFSGFALVVIWMLSLYITAVCLGAGGIYVYRVNAVFGCYLICIVEGIRFIYEVIYQYKENVAKIFAALIGCIYVVSFIMFAKYYFCNYVEDTYLIDYFDFKFDDVLEYMENDLPEGVSDRTTYIAPGNQTYIYYLGSELLSPYEYNELVDDKPYTLWLWTQSYKNFRFYTPEDIDPTGNYIVPEASTETIERYEQYGFSNVHIGTYYLFWNDMLSAETSNAEAVISWDHGIVDGEIMLDDGESTALSGWCLDATDGMVWQYAVAVIDNQYYIAEKMDRSDVAGVLGNDDLTVCGFRFTIPNEVLEKGDVRIVFGNLKYKNNYIENY